eukprot:6039512-Prorocentrum_lima.AAC.1
MCMRSIVLRISPGASDLSLRGATHGINILWVPLCTLCAMMSRYLCPFSPAVPKGPVRSTWGVPDLSALSDLR